MTSLPTLPGFRVLGRIGSGGMGEVFRAVRVGPGGFRKPVALKRLAVVHSLDARQVQRFFREARLCAQLEHPNIVEVHDLIADQAGYFIVMELLRGCTWLDLDARVERGALPWWLQLAIADQALAALEYAHALRDEAGRRVGLVHRDLTPRNLFVCASGTVKVVDFGLARVLEGLTGRLTGEGQLAGTLEYLSPEQARGEEVDARSDLYQLGACLHRALTGDAPHGGGSPSEVLARAMIGEAAPVGERRPDLPGAVCAVVDRALAGDRERRFADAAAMRAAVRAALAGAPERGDDALVGVMARVRIDLGPEEREQDGELDIDEQPGGRATADLGHPLLVGADRAGQGEPPARRPGPVDAARPGREAPRRRGGRARRVALAIGALGLAAGLTAIGFWLGRSAAPVAPEPAAAAARAQWTRLSFRRGLIEQARFTGDGATFAYAARWGADTADIFLGAPGDPVPRARELAGADLLAASRRRELALLVDVEVTGRHARRGVLARAPLDAGALARAELRDVQWADYGPGGELAVVRWAGGAARLEYPPGTVLLEEKGGWLGAPRISPDGAAVAIARHPSLASERGWLELVDRGGGARRLGPDWAVLGGLAWRPDGREVWFSAADGGALELRAASASGGAVRTLASAPGGIALEDVAPDGSALVRRDEIDLLVWAGRRNDPPLDLSWLDGSSVYDVSRDGRTFLMGDGQPIDGAPDRAHPRVLIRRSDGSPAVAVAEGFPGGLLENASGALVIAPDRASLALVPTGGGEPRPVPIGDLRPIGKAAVAPDGDLVLVGVTRAGQPEEIYLVELASGARRRIGRPGLELPPIGGSISSDSKQVALVEASTDLLVLVSLDVDPGGNEGGEVRPAPGAQPGEGFARFRTRRALYVARLGGTRIDVGRIDLDTRTRELWRTFRPPDPSGVLEISTFALGTLSDSYAFTCRRRLSTLYLVQGL